MHRIASKLLNRTVRVALVGAGGSGSLMFTLLARMHLALVERGHPGGLHVDVYDGDVVSPANVGRQLYYEMDVGYNKAEVLVHRLNLTYQLSWRAFPNRFESANPRNIDIIIGCVDTAASRLAIDQQCDLLEPFYWLDLGNRANDGQCVLGQPLGRDRDWYMRLPTIIELFPDLRNPAPFDDNDEPSCSLADALEKQDLFVNQILVGQAANMLWQLFRYGEIGFASVFVNLRSGHVTSVPIDRDQWKRFGFKGARKPRSKHNPV